MSRVLTTDDLIRSLKRRALIPTDQSTFSPDDFLEILDEELTTGILPYLLEMNEEHLVTSVDIPLDSDTEAPYRYKIPTRAIGNKLRDAAYVDSAGNYYEITRVSLEELSDYNSYYGGTFGNVVYVEGDEVVITSSTDLNQGIMRMFFYVRPSTLVLQEKVGKILSISVGATETTLSLDKIPEEFPNLPLFDVVGSKDPCKLKKFDLTASSVDLNTQSITFPNISLPEDLVVGDYICVEGESPVPQVISELHPILAQRAAVYCLESLGDTEGLANAIRKLEKMEKGVSNLIENRIEGAPQKIKPRHTTLQDTRDYFYGNRRRRL